MRADLQLERLLYILPVAARGEGARIDDLARALDVEPATVVRDLHMAMTRAFYHPAGFVEPFTVSIENDVVRVYASSEFNRPVRLTQQEALALGLGLRTLAAEAEQPRRAEILAFAARLEAELRVPDDLATHGALAAGLEERAMPDELRSAALERDLEELARPQPLAHDVEYEPDVLISLGDDALRGIVADAIEQHRMLRIMYMKPGDAAPAERRLAPYRLVFAEGSWYIAAHDAVREDFRFFRLDRVLAATIEDEVVEPLPEVDLQALLRDGVAYHARDDVQVTVRYAGAIARWILEQREGEPQPDGSVVVTHNVADPDWFVRHVLQYGGAATVEAPAEARRWVSAAARQAVRG